MSSLLDDFELVEPNFGAGILNNRLALDRRINGVAA